MELLFGILAYGTVGVLLANRYWFPRRHGVRGRLGAGLDSIDAGFLGAVAVAWTWPVAIWLPTVRHPEPCRHEHHVLAREEARQRFARVDDALRYENGG